MGPHTPADIECGRLPDPHFPRDPLLRMAVRFGSPRHDSYNGVSMPVDLDKLWRDPNAFAEVAQRIGQEDPQRRRWEPPANENAPARVGLLRRLLTRLGLRRGHRGTREASTRVTVGD